MPGILGLQTTLLHALGSDNIIFVFFLLILPNFKAWGIFGFAFSSWLLVWDTCIPPNISAPYAFFSFSVLLIVAHQNGFRVSRVCVNSPPGWNLTIYLNCAYCIFVGEAIQYLHHHLLVANAFSCWCQLLFQFSCSTEVLHNWELSPRFILTCVNPRFSCICLAAFVWLWHALKLDIAARTSYHVLWAGIGWWDLHRATSSAQAFCSFCTLLSPAHLPLLGTFCWPDPIPLLSRCASKHFNHSAKLS